MQANDNFVLRWLPFLGLAAILVALPTFADPAIASLVVKILIFGLLVMSLDLLVGYAGLWSFGHAGFFGIGAYATAILATKLNVTNFWLSASASVLVAALVACVFGFFALRVSHIYFLLITLAMGQLVFGVVSTSVGRVGEITGGSDGLTGVPYPHVGFEITSDSFYYFVLISVAICTFIMMRVADSPFGYGLRGIRENEPRLLALGYNTWLFKFIAFVISGAFAALAGVLFVHFNGFISPASVGLETTGILWLMIIIGGSGTLWGAFVGSAVVLSLQYFVSSITPERWPLIVGACFIASVFLFRDGIYPYFRTAWVRAIGHGGPAS